MIAAALLAATFGCEAQSGAEFETDTDFETDNVTATSGQPTGIPDPESTSTATTSMPSTSAESSSDDAGEASTSGGPDDCDDCDNAWTPPRPISERSNFISQPRLAVGDNGNAIAIWLRGDSVRSNRYHANVGAWEASPTLVHEAPANIALWDLGPQLDVAIDAAGDAIAVWNGVLTDAKRGDLYAARFDAAGGVWLGAQLIEHDDTGSISNARLVMHPLGDAIVVWHQYGTVRRRVRQNRFDASSGTWLGEEPLEPADPALPWDSNAPRIAINTQGNAAVAWPGPNDGAGGTRTPTVRQFFASSDLWTPAERPQPAGGAGARVALDEMGNVMVAWTFTSNFGGTRLYVARFDVERGGWSEGEQLRSTGGAIALSDVFAVDAAGNALLVWRDQDSDVEDTPFDVRATRFNADASTWGPVRLLETHDDSILDAAVALSPGGGGVALWVRSGAESRDLVALRFLADLEDWGSAEALLHDETRTLEELDVRIDGTGSATAIWLQREEDEDTAVMVSHFD